MSKSVLPFKEVISVSNCVILWVLKEAIAMAVIEMPSTMKHLGHPGIEISID
jgi:hypothetical protein